MPKVSDYNKCGMLINKSEQEQPVRTWTRVETFCNIEAYKNFTTEQLDFRRKQEILKYKKNANTISKKQLYSYVNKFRNVKNTSTFIKKGNTLICPYEYYDEWVQLGEDICGNEANDLFGLSIALNSEGNILAIGSPFSDISGQNSGLVEVYQYNQITNMWQQQGQDICGNNNSDAFGSSVALNSNGDILAVGSPYSDISGQDSGLVEVYQYNQITNMWQQQGQDICGNKANDAFGRSVALNSNGDILAVSSPFHDINGTDSGLVEVYQYNQNTNMWQQQGQDICGNKANDIFGWSIALNSEGNILACGSHNSDINGKNSGLVEVYQYNQNTNMWQQQGQDICGNKANDLFGWSIALNSEGNILASGAPESVNISGINSGIVQVYNLEKTEPKVPLVNYNTIRSYPSN